MLGKFEEDFVDYIKKLRLAGGIVNHSITIAAARGIISVKNQQVLAEHGGLIELTNCFKDFLTVYKLCLFFCLVDVSTTLVLRSV